MGFDKRRQKVLFYLLSAILLIAANLFLFNTFDIYRENPSEFEVGYLSLLGSVWLWGLLFIFLTLLPGLVLPLAVVKKYASFLLVLGILTWIQAGILMWDYGVLDGRGTHWEQYDALGWLGGLIWLSALAASLRFARHILPYSNLLAWILITGQTLLLISDGGLKQGFWTRDYVPSTYLPEKILEVSKQQNIVHIVLDSLQTDIFLELIEDKAWYDEFSGFTVFYENSAVTPHTSLALPAIFSGELFDGSQSPAAYYKGAMSNGFQTTLYQAGFTVNLIPQLSMRDSSFSNYYEIPSTYTGTNDDLNNQNAAQLMDIALFRSSPHFLRKILYNDGDWFLLPIVRGEMRVPSFQEKAFLADYTQGLKPGSDTPAYHFIHITPPHPPYVTLADGGYAGNILANTRENFLNESRAALELVVRYIEKLKSLGVYDNALIVLQGDHGSQINPLINGKEIQPCLPRLPALLAIKSPGAEGLLKTSDVPTSLLDIAPTILKVLKHEGKSVFELDESLLRQRPFIVFDGKKADAKIVNYSIRGSVYDPQSCSLENQQAVNSETVHYELGTEIKFGMTGNADPFMGTGWSVCQSIYCWSNASLASLNLPVDGATTDLMLHVRIRPFVDEIKVPRQRVGVSVNGTHLTEWSVSLDKFQNVSVRIPAELTGGDALQIGFHFPDAVSPSSLELGGDKRLLGIAIARLRVDQLNDE